MMTWMVIRQVTAGHEHGSEAVVIEGSMWLASACRQWHYCMGCGCTDGDLQQIYVQTSVGNYISKIAVNKQVEQCRHEDRQD
jgi:hypothetical protein